MKQITHSLELAVTQALNDNPDLSADEFMRDIGTAVSDAETRKVIRTAWLRAKLDFADREGGEFTVEEVFADVYAAIDEEIAKNAT